MDVSSQEAHPDFDFEKKLLLHERIRYQTMYLQSTLVISKSKGPSETL